jgi:hypothetical protein
MTTIHADRIGPFTFERLTGTPDDTHHEDDRLSRALCHGCRNWFDLDELKEMEGGWYCEECESKKEGNHGR